MIEIRTLTKKEQLEWLLVFLYENSTCFLNNFL